MKEFAGTMRHRESPGETVSLAQLGRTRAPLYSASLPLRGPTKAFLVFDTTTIILVAPRPLLFLRFFFQLLVPLPLFSRHPLARNEPRDYRCAGLTRKKKRKGGAQGVCSSLVATFTGSTTRTTAHATLSKKKRERLETRIIAVFSLAAKVKEKAIEVAIVMQNAQLSGHRVQPAGFVSPVYA